MIAILFKKNQPRFELIELGKKQHHFRGILDLNKREILINIFFSFHLIILHGWSTVRGNVGSEITSVTICVNSLKFKISLKDVNKKIHMQII